MLLVPAIMHFYEGRSETQVTQQAAFDEKEQSKDSQRCSNIV